MAICNTPMSDICSRRGITIWTCLSDPRSGWGIWKVLVLDRWIRTHLYLSSACRICLALLHNRYSPYCCVRPTALGTCGIWPDCQKIIDLSSCHNGYYRNYYCADNSIMYSEACTSYCCESYMGETGYCTGGVCYGSPDACQDECTFSGDTCIDGNTYSCEMQLDGCKDLIFKENCTDECLGGQCFDESQMMGKIFW